MGGVVSCPRAPVAAKCSVSTVSVGAHTGPETRTPDKHSTIIVKGEIRTEPVKSTPDGLKTK